MSGYDQQAPFGSDEDRGKGPAEAPHAGLVLLSGGLDSTVCAAIAARETMAPLAVTFDYGQRHRREIESAAAVASHYGMSQLVVSLDATAWGGSALTDPSSVVPRARQHIGALRSASEPLGGGHDVARGGEAAREMDERPTGSSDAPATYVPARNTIFLAVAVAVAEARDIDAVYIGVNAVDYSGYPDCRPEYLNAFRAVACLGTKRGIEGRPVEICAPLISLSKREIVDLGNRLEAPLELSWSCYEGGIAPCGVCEACAIRIRAFDEAGLADPFDEAGLADPGNVRSQPEQRPQAGLWTGNDSWTRSKDSFDGDPHDVRL